MHRLHLFASAIKNLLPTILAYTGVIDQHVMGIQYQFFLNLISQLFTLTKRFACQNVD